MSDTGDDGVRPSDRPSEPDRSDVGDLTKEIVAASTLQRMKAAQPPTKRAAYSDRMAAKMAALSQLAYEPLDEEQRETFAGVAESLLNISGLEQMQEKLQTVLEVLHNPKVHYNERLRRALELGGLTLAGTLFSRFSFTDPKGAGHDTQGFVAYRKPDPTVPDDPGMLVVVFRGTQQWQDWLTNIKFQPDPVLSTKETRFSKKLGVFHKGFHEAYKCVADQMQALIDQHPELPVFVTGHSLGGALATIATWYIDGARLAACYTFGAPRSGDRFIGRRYRTPVYRIVNAIDPVPFVPPSGKVTEAAIWGLKRMAHLGFPVANKIADRLGQDVPLFEPPGDQRFLPYADPDKATGAYEPFQLEYNVTSFERGVRYAFYLLTGKAKRLDTYHDMDIYRRKLEAYAGWRQTGEA